MSMNYTFNHYTHCLLNFLWYCCNSIFVESLSLGRMDSGKARKFFPIAYNQKFQPYNTLLDSLFNLKRFHFLKHRTVVFFNKECKNLIQIALWRLEVCLSKCDLMLCLDHATKHLDNVLLVFVLNIFCATNRILTYRIQRFINFNLQRLL